jgi:hypothetical protein
MVHDTSYIKKTLNLESGERAFDGLEVIVMEKGSGDNSSDSQRALPPPLADGSTTSLISLTVRAMSLTVCVMSLTVRGVMKPVIRGNACKIEVS